MTEEIPIIPKERIKEPKVKVGEKPITPEYLEELAKRKGFKSHKEYYNFKIQKRKERLEEIGKEMVRERQKSEKTSKKKDEKVEKLIKTIEERSIKAELKKIKEDASNIQETQKQIDRFKLMTDFFQKKVHECDLYKITRDIIESEELTRDIDKNIRSLPDKYISKYFSLLMQHKDSVAFLEKNCKCNPTTTK